MLQNLTDSTASCDLERCPPENLSLSPLAVVRVLPERYSRHMQMLAKLKQIRQLHVSPRGKSVSNKQERVYLVEVYTSPRFASHIPTTLKKDELGPADGGNAFCASTTCEPDVRVAKMFGDFVRLRDALYDASQTSHGFKRCDFCNEVTRYILLGVVQPGCLVSWVLPHKQRARAADEFINDILRLATACPIVVSEACWCQEQVPKQLYKFLFESALTAAP